MRRFRVGTVRDQGCNVYVQDIFSKREVEARRQHMLDMGWGPDQVWAELGKMQAENNVCEQPHDLDISTDYIWSYSEPGDLVEIGPYRSIVQDWGYA